MNISSEPPSFDLYESDVGWAKALEIVSDIPTDGVRETLFQVPANSSYLLVAVTGHDIGIAIFFPKTDEEERQAFIESSNGPELFAHVEGESVVLGVMKAPQEGEWRVIVASDGESSFSFHMLAFDEKALRKEASNASQMSLPLKCRACLVASKGVGASICVAAGLAAVPVIPAALVGAVGSFLGIGAPVAAAFIGKAVEEFYDGIA